MKIIYGYCITYKVSMLVIFFTKKAGIVWILFEFMSLKYIETKKEMLKLTMLSYADTAALVSKCFIFALQNIRSQV